MEQTQLQQLEELYQNYLEDVRQTAAKRTFGEGLFGFGKKLSDEPCHMAFLDRIKAFLEVAAKNTASEEAAELLSFLFERPGVYQELDSSIYWTMAAAHGQGKILIPRLNPEDAKQLCQSYEKANPKRSRLPIQEEILKALKKQM